MESIDDFYSKKIAEQLGEIEARSLAIENARIHINKLIVIVSKLGRKDLAFEYNKFY